MEATVAIMVAATVQAGMSIMQGNAQAASLKGRALMTLSRSRSDIIRSRAEALKHKKAANDALEKMNRTLATVTAYGGQGLDPFQGSVGTIATNIMKKGFSDYGAKKDSAAIEKENQAIIKYTAEFQAASYRKAASRARAAGYMGAAMSLASGYATASTLGTPASTPTPQYSTVNTVGPWPY